MHLTELIFNKYAAQFGSDQIATKLALRIISDHLEKNNPQSILEIGAGIGTITELLIKKSPNSNILSFEKDEWCLSQLLKNVDEKQIQIFSKKQDLLTLQKIDFLIIDDYLDAKFTFELISKTRPESIFIEGHRRRQRLSVIRSYMKIGFNFDLKNYRKSYDSDKGGCLVIHNQESQYKQYIYLSFILLTIFYAQLSIIRSKVPLRQLNLMSICEKLKIK